MVSILRTVDSGSSSKAPSLWDSHSPPDILTSRPRRLTFLTTTLRLDMAFEPADIVTTKTAGRDAGIMETERKIEKKESKFRQPRVF